MATRKTYQAIFTPFSEKGRKGYTVEIDGMPEVHTWGRSNEHALEMIFDALELEHKVMRNDGKRPPSSFVVQPMMAPKENLVAV